MSKNIFKNKKIWIIIGTSFLFMSIVVGASIGIFFCLRKNKINSNNPNNQIINYKYRQVSIFPTAGNNGPTIKEGNLKEANNEDLTDDHGRKIIYWLGINGLEILRTKIQNELGYGPEIFQLKSIIINNDNINNKEAHGFYSPLTNEIFINVDNFKKNIFDYYRPTPSDEYVRAQLIFDIIFHEYNHHLVNSYLQNAPISDSYMTNTIWRQNEDSKWAQVSWNKYFVNQFKKYLHYDDDRNTPKYPDDIILEPIAGKTPNTSQTLRLKSIGSLYSAKDLFERANGKVIDKNNQIIPIAPGENNWKEMEIDPNDPHKFDGYIFGGKNPTVVQPPIISNNLNYLYSLDEIFARKYQQLNQPYNAYANYLLKNGQPPIEGPIWGYLANGYIKTFIPGQTIASPFLIDTLHYQNNLTFTNSIERYLYDAPFDNEKIPNLNLPKYNIEMYNLMDQMMGHAFGDQLSYIWSNNDSVILDNNTIKLSSEKINSEIKFGGYISIPSSSPINQKKYVGWYEKNDENNRFIQKEIEIHPFTYKTKIALTSRSKIPLDPLFDNNFYTTKTWINPKDIVGKKLYFKFDDINKPAPLKRARHQFTAGASTYYNYLFLKLEGYDVYIGKEKGTGNNRTVEIDEKQDWETKNKNTRSRKIHINFKDQDLHPWNPWKQTHENQQLTWYMNPKKAKDYFKNINK